MIVPLVMVLNTAATVGIVLFTKFLYSHDLKFPTTLLFFHQSGICIVTFILGVCGQFDNNKCLPFSVKLKLALSEVVSIVFVNLSLVHNTVGTYQMLKLLNAPAMCVAEYFMLGKSRGWMELVTLFGIVSGVGMVTVTDMIISQNGLMFGLVAVVGTTAYQVFVKRDKQEYDLTGLQFLASQTPLTVACLFPCVFLTDDVMGAVQHRYTLPQISMILITCVCAFAICLSMIYLIGQTSAVTYQVLGHVKTVLIIVGGVLVFHQPVSVYNTVGFVAVLGGSVLFSQIKT